MNTRSKCIRKQLKKLALFIATFFDAEIQIIQANNAIIEKSIKTIITRQIARQAMEVFVAVATIKNSIQIDSNVEFDVDGDSNASSADN
jgi:hypothetical protein